MFTRRSNIFFIFLFGSTLLFCLMFIHARTRQESDRPLLHERGEIVRVLGLTDLCLFTEARYTRHPTLADLNTPFQDYPMSFEHFPSGSIVAAPPHLHSPAHR